LGAADAFVLVLGDDFVPLGGDVGVHLRALPLDRVLLRVARHAVVDCYAFCWHVRLPRGMLVPVRFLGGVGGHNKPRPPPFPSGHARFFAAALMPSVWASLIFADSSSVSSRQI